jgi:hypothetical protein
MIVGRPGDTITLQFSRPTALKPTPWRVSLPRVLPRPAIRLATNQSQRLVQPSPASPPASSSLINVKNVSPQQSSQFEPSVRVIMTCNETWNNRYGSQEEAEADYKRMVRQYFCVQR